MSSNYDDINRAVKLKQTSKEDVWKDVQYIPAEASRMVTLEMLAKADIEKPHGARLVFRHKEPLSYNLISTSEVRETTNLREALNGDPKSFLAYQYHIGRAGLIVRYLSLEDDALLQAAKSAYYQILAKDKSCSKTKLDKLLHAKEKELYSSHYKTLLIIGEYQMWHDISAQQANIVTARTNSISALVINGGRKVEKAVFRYQSESKHISVPAIILRYDS